MTLIAKVKGIEEYFTNRICSKIKKSICFSQIILWEKYLNLWNCQFQVQTHISNQEVYPNHLFANGRKEALLKGLNKKKFLLAQGNIIGKFQSKKSSNLNNAGIKMILSIIKFKFNLIYLKSSANLSLSIQINFNHLKRSKDVICWSFQWNLEFH